MKRIKRLLIGVITFSGIVLTACLSMANDNKDRETNATVSFGQWDPNDVDLSSPLDRFLSDPTGGVGNNHELLPNIVKISAGDSVSFIISR